MSDRINRLISAERKRPPERAANTPSVRRGQGSELIIRKMYCKAAPGAATGITCYVNYDGYDADAYAAETTYAAGDIVESSGTAYRSIQGGNTGNTPASSPGWWTPIEEIYVNFCICGGSTLNSVYPRLEGGKWFYAIYNAIEEQWDAFYPAQACDEDCEE
ncbi:MAG: carbohydrate-binding protein [Patescibacteria group bacterium]